jgi:hypothetical protein
MNTRAALQIGLWASLVVGAVTLFDGSAVRSAGALVVFGAGVLGAKAFGAARLRWLRVRSWPRPGESELFPAGPRRVPLVETGLAGPGSARSE